MRREGEGGSEGGSRQENDLRAKLSWRRGVGGQNPPPAPAHNKAMILGTDSDGVGKNVADYLFSKSPLT